ncbi:MAG: FAD-dependent monooxygenase [Eubacterium sp.]
MKYNVVIIGGGPAAMFSALYLKKYGVKDICIVNKNNHKIHKACSGFLTKKTVTLMKEIDLLVEKELNYSKGNDLIVYNNYQECLKLNEEDIYIYFSSSANREDLDNYLYNKVLEENIKILENNQITEIIFDKHILNLKDSKILYNYLIMADGFVGISSKYNIKPKDKQIGLEVRIKNSKKLVPKVDLNFGITKYGYAWIFQQEKYTTIGFTDLYNNKINYLELLKEFASKKGYNIETKNIKGAFIPRKVQKLYYDENSIFIGDAAGLVDSITQEGIYYALLSAKYSALAIKENNLKIYKENMKYIIKELNASRWISKLFYTSFFQKKLWKNKKDANSFRAYILKKTLTEEDFSYRKIFRYFKEYKTTKKFRTKTF